MNVRFQFNLDGHPGALGDGIALVKQMLAGEKVDLRDESRGWLVQSLNLFSKAHTIDAHPDAYGQMPGMSPARQRWMEKTGTGVNPLSHVALLARKAVNDAMRGAGDNYVVAGAEPGLLDSGVVSDFVNHYGGQTAIVVSAGSLHAFDLLLPALEKRLAEPAQDPPLVLQNDDGTLSPLIERFGLDRLTETHGIHVTHSVSETARILKNSAAVRLARVPVPDSPVKIKDRNTVSMSSGNVSKREQDALLFHHGFDGKVRLYPSSWINRGEKAAVEDGGNGGVNAWLKYARSSRKMKTKVAQLNMESAYGDDGAKEERERILFNIGGKLPDCVMTEDRCFAFNFGASPEEIDMLAKYEHVVDRAGPHWPGPDMAEATKHDGNPGVFRTAYRVWDALGTPEEERTITARSVIMIGSFDDPDQMLPVMGTKMYKVKSLSDEELANAEYDDLFIDPDTNKTIREMKDEGLITGYAGLAVAALALASDRDPPAPVVEITRPELPPLEVVTNARLRWEGDALPPLKDIEFSGQERDGHGISTAQNVPELRRLETMGPFVDSGNAFLMIPPEGVHDPAERRIMDLLFLTTVFEGKSMGDPWTAGKSLVIFNEDGYYDPLIELMTFYYAHGITKGRLDDFATVVNGRDEIVPALRKNFNPFEYVASPPPMDDEPLVLKVPVDPKNLNFVHFTGAATELPQPLETTAKIAAMEFNAGAVVRSGGGAKASMGVLYKTGITLKHGWGSANIVKDGVQCWDSLSEGFPKGSLLNGFYIQTAESFYKRIGALVMPGGIPMDAAVLDGGAVGSLREAASVNAVNLRPGNHIPMLVSNISNNYEGTNVPCHEAFLKYLGAEGIKRGGIQVFDKTWKIDDAARKIQYAKRMRTARGLDMAQTQGPLALDLG